MILWVILFFTKLQAVQLPISLRHTHTFIFIYYRLFEVYRLIPELFCWRWLAPGEGGPIAGYAGTAKVKDKLSVIHLWTGSKSVDVRV